MEQLLVVAQPATTDLHLQLPYSPISSFQTSGRSRINPASSDLHSAESRSTTSTPFSRSQSSPPWNVSLSPTITRLNPNCRISPEQYQHGASVVTIVISR